MSRRMTYEEFIEDIDFKNRDVSLSYINKIFANVTSDIFAIAESNFVMNLIAHLIRKENNVHIAWDMNLNNENGLLKLAKAQETWENVKISGLYLNSRKFLSFDKTNFDNLREYQPDEYFLNSDFVLFVLRIKKYTGSKNDDMINIMKRNSMSNKPKMIWTI